MGRPKRQTVCFVDGCDVEAVTRDWCRTHYNRWYTTGDVQADKPIKRRPSGLAGYRICSFRDCINRSWAHELCSGHLKQKTKGLILSPLKEQNRERTYCTFPGCERPNSSYGLCSGHAIQRREGRSLAPLRPLAPKGSGTTNKDGYRLIRGRMEHRVVMEKVLGRSLRPDETVHHINGIRSDNRPENLELWVRQPPGQRAADLLSWARDIVERYETEEELLLKDGR